MTRRFHESGQRGMVTIVTVLLERSGDGGHARSSRIGRREESNVTAMNTTGAIARIPRASNHQRDEK